MLELAIALARAILADRERREQASADEQLANSIVARVAVNIERAKNDIINFLRQQQLTEIVGRVEGMFNTFERYAADPRANEDRLVRLIDDLAQLLGIMNRLMAENERQLLAVFPTYACGVSLSLMSISERRHRFGVNEITAGLPEEAKAHALNVKAILRRRSDNRFHLATQRDEPGSFNLGYTFDDRFHFVAIVFDRQNPARALERVNRQMAAHQEREFPLFPGVREVTQLLEELDDVIAMETFIDATRALPVADLIAAAPVVAPRLDVR
jgi:hypothetical protein